MVDFLTVPMLGYISRRQRGEQCKCNIRYNIEHRQRCNAGLPLVFQRTRCVYHLVSKMQLFQCLSSQQEALEGAECSIRLLPPPAAGGAEGSV